jgi:FAD dependent monooxygenase
MSCRMGYICGVCERMKFLKSLYDQLEDKSTVKLNKKAVEIVHEQDGVIIRCADGTEYRGDVVIGGDGIHSRTRRAMQKFIEDSGHSELLVKDQNCKSQYISILLC